MKPTTKAYLELHVAVFLFGFTAILGDLISLSATLLVWWRVLITCISLFFLLRFGKKMTKLSVKMTLILLGIGVLVALHWITFFGAIKYSNASITLIALATASFFTAFLEPLILKRPVSTVEVLLGLLIVPGMILVVNNIDLSMYMGIYLGLLSAFLAATFSILNKKYIDDADPMTITFIELGSAWLFISVCLPFVFSYSEEPVIFWPTGMDVVYLLILALACTTLAYILSLRALKHLTAFASNLTINLEPVYGIILAWLILNENEELDTGFYLGCLLIVAVVFAYPLLRKRFK